MKFGEWEFTYDRQATAAGYDRAPAGGSGSCDCIWCRNFVLVRDSAYPIAFRVFLESLVIDPAKDGEVYHNREVEPGIHHYAGWFHFVGSLEKSGDLPVVEMASGFKVWLRPKGAPELVELKGLSLVQVEFQAERVPWVLEERAPN